MQTDWLPQGGTLMKRTIVANAVALSLAAGAYAQSTSQPQAKAETGSSSSGAASQSSTAAGPACRARRCATRPNSLTAPA